MDRAEPGRPDPLPVWQRDVGTTGMKKRATLIALWFVGAGAFEPAVQAEEKFQKLSGPQIRARFAGMEMTDGTHWADVFLSNGTLTTYAMGRKSSGKWDVQKDELCVDRGKDDSGCYQVWLSGKNVELRHDGSNLPLEGILQRPAARN
jgi:hypothetical protein